MLTAVRGPRIGVRAEGCGRVTAGQDKAEAELTASAFQVTGGQRGRVVLTYRQ